MQLHFADDGPGPVVVLLHGFPFDLSSWDPQRTTLGSVYRVICPDLRGHGQSAAPEGDSSIDVMADDVIELLDALGLREPVVVGGLSMGGYVALSLAIRYPNRLRGLMLLNTKATADTPQAARVRIEQADEIDHTGKIDAVTSAMLPKLFGDITRARRPEVVSQIHDLMMQSSPRGVAGTLRGLAVRPDRTSSLSKITTPTLVLAGEEDAIIPVEESRSMAALIPNSEFVVIPETGHLSPLEDPATVNPILLRFLGSLA